MSGGFRFRYWFGLSIRIRETPWHSSLDKVSECRKPNPDHDLDNNPNPEYALELGPILSCGGFVVALWRVPIQLDPRRRRTQAFTCSRLPFFHFMKQPLLSAMVARILALTVALTEGNAQIFLTLA